MRKARTPDWRFVGWPYKALYTVVVPWHNRVLVRARGVDGVPREGGVVLASNHAVAWDPCLLQCCLPRPVLWMAKKELFQNRFNGWFFRTVGCIPVDRSRRNPEALAAARAALRDGAIVGVFPEGTRRLGGGLGEPKPGAARLALEAGAPVVPVGVAWPGGPGRAASEGPRGAKRPRLGERVYVSFGAPVRLEGDAKDHDAVARGSSAIMEAIGRELAGAIAAREARAPGWRAP